MFSICVNQNSQLLFEVELDRLEQYNSSLSQADYASLVKQCGNSKSAFLAQSLYKHFIHQRLDTSGFLGENLVISLAKCGALDESFHVFHSLPVRTTFAWTGLISGLTDYGHPRKALSIYRHMLDDGIEPDSYTFVSLFKACALIPDLKEGRKLHKEAYLKGLTDELFVGNTLLRMYGKCGGIFEAEQLFTDLSKRDVVTTNNMMSMYVENRQAKRALLLYRQMCEQSANLLDDHTLVLVLQAVRLLAEEEWITFRESSSSLIAFEIGRALHAEARHRSISSSHLVGNTLISMYGSCRMLDHALNTLHDLTNPNIVSKTAILSAFLDQGHAERTLQYYCRLSLYEINDNYQTFLLALQACSVLATKEEGYMLENGNYVKKNSLEIGRAVHEDAHSMGHETSPFVANTLVSMYGKCGAIPDAESVFIRLAHKDVVTWNAMLSAYIEHGRAKHALSLYRQMLEDGFTPNRQTFLMVLRACEIMAIESLGDPRGNGEPLGLEVENIPISFEIGVALHADIKKKGLQSDVFVGATLIKMYGKHGAVPEAENAFCNLHYPDLICCTAMMSVLVDHRIEENALLIYKKMQEEHTSLDEVTISCILEASLNIGRSEIVKDLHFIIASAGMESDSRLLSVALIHAYGCAGSIADSNAVFDRLPCPDMNAQNAFIAAGTGEANCLWMFEQMQLKCFNPDASRFTSVLSSCTHEGLVEAGILYSMSMNRDFSLQKELNHSILLVDLYGRAGDFSRAMYLIRSVPKQTELSAWLCLLSACCIHGNVELGKDVFDHVVSLQTDDPSAYILMSNMYVEDQSK
ncbi:hypothetical protein KP509_25G039100 [Ceratopteris richardii]|nr:hypothetical protein KP509_25G039100 [Ceratopteris richardii]